jgi:hypothetical protein
MKVSQERVLEVLRDSVIEGLEGRQKGSKFPTLHTYLEMEGEDIDNPTVRRLREEFARIQQALPNLHIGLYQEGSFVPVDGISGRVRMSNPDAGLLLTSVGLARDFPARENLGEVVRQSLDICDEAIRRDCGFGKYTTP